MPQRKKSRCRIAHLMCSRVKSADFYTHIHEFSGNSADDSCCSCFARLCGYIAELYCERLIPFRLYADYTVLMKSYNSNNVKVYSRSKHTAVLMVCVVTADFSSAGS